MRRIMRESVIDIRDHDRLSIERKAREKRWFEHVTVAGEKMMGTYNTAMKICSG